jgi:hypothetical protein
MFIAEFLLLVDSARIPHIVRTTAQNALALLREPWNDQSEFAA